MEFGARVKGVVNDMIFSLNYFNGLSNSGQLKLIGAPDVTVAPDGTPVLHLPLEERFPRYQMVGATFTSDFPSVSSSALGGVAPVLRLEAERVFNNTMGIDATPPRTAVRKIHQEGRVPVCRRGGLESEGGFSESEGVLLPLRAVLSPPYSWISMRT